MPAGADVLDRPDVLDDIDEETDETEDLDDVDEADDSVAHYVHKRKITDSSVFGTPLRTLCGKKIVSKRSPDGLPVCSTCKHLYENVCKD